MRAIKITGAILDQINTVATRSKIQRAHAALEETNKLPEGQSKNLIIHKIMESIQIQKPIMAHELEQFITSEVSVITMLLSIAGETSSGDALKDGEACYQATDLEAIKNLRRQRQKQGSDSLAPSPGVTSASGGAGQSSTPSSSGGQTLHPAN